MADGLPRQSALAHLRLALRTLRDPGQADVRLSELPARTCLNLRAEATPEIRAIVAERIGCGLPLHPSASTRKRGMTALWLGPDEWLIAGDSAAGEIMARLDDGFRGRFVAVTDVSDAYCVIGLAGKAAEKVLSKGCSLDLHPEVFEVGYVARTLCAKAGVILHRTRKTGFEIYVRRSYADYLWRWLEDAGKEFDVAVI